MEDVVDLGEVGAAPPLDHVLAEELEPPIVQQVVHVSRGAAGSDEVVDADHRVVPLEQRVAQV
jgi:hypothetical protein